MESSLQLLDELSELTDQMKLSSAEELKQLTDSANDHERYAAQRVERQLAEMQALSLQLKKARIFTKNSNYRDALQNLQRLESKLSSLLVSDRALEAFIELTGELQVLQQHAYQVWYADIDALIEDARRVCLAAETSADMDALILRLAALEMKRPNSTNNVVVTRGTEKLRGTVNTVQSWMRYLDQRRAGNSEAANNTLKQLERSSSNFPLLTREQLAGKWMKETKVENPDAVAIEILARITEDPDTLVQAIRSFEAAVEDPQLSKNEYFQHEVIPQLTAYKKGFEALEAKDFETAESVYKSINRGSRSALFPYTDALKNRLSNGVTALRLEQFIGEPIDMNQPVDAQVEVYLEQFWNEGKLLKIKEILNLQSYGKKTQAALATRKILGALNDYLTGQQFEQANDVVSAYQSYRKTLKYTGQGHPLNDLAIAALKRLRATAPDRIDRFDDSALIQEIQELREELNRTMRMRHSYGR